jgi:hypothetical protein
MKKWLIRSITEYLADWFVPIADYDFVQDQRWAAEKRIDFYTKELSTMFSHQLTKEWNDAIDGNSIS